MALQTTVQRRPGQVWDRRLQPIKAIIQRQQRVPPERNDDGFLVDLQHRGFGILGPGRQIGNRGPLAPLHHRLLIGAMPLGQRPQALLTIL